MPLSRQNNKKTDAKFLTAIEIFVISIESSIERPIEAHRSIGRVIFSRGWLLILLRRQIFHQDNEKMCRHGEVWWRLLAKMQVSSTPYVQTYGAQNHFEFFWQQNWINYAAKSSDPKNLATGAIHFQHTWKRIALIAKIFRSEDLAA